MLAEALCLSAAGGLLGLAIPAAAATFIERIVPIGLPALTVSPSDWRLLAFAAALSLGTAVLFSLGPALQSTHASTADVLQQHARGSIGGRSRAFRDGLVVVQVAATLVLLVAAGLMLRTFANLNAVELGFDANNLLTMQVPLMPKYADPNKRPPFYERIISGVGALPGVRGVALAWTLPFQATGNTRSFSVWDVSQCLETSATRCSVWAADYLQTLRVRPIEGPARRARYRQRPSRRSRQQDARPPIHAGAIGARPPNPLRPREPRTRSWRGEGRSGAWISAGTEARCLRRAGTGAALLPHGS